MIQGIAGRGCSRDDSDSLPFCVAQPMPSQPCLHLGFHRSRHADSFCLQPLCFGAIPCPSPVQLEAIVYTICRKCACGLPTMVAAHQHTLNWLLLNPVSLPHAPACANTHLDRLPYRCFLDHLPNKLLALKPLSQRPPAEQLNPRQQAQTLWVLVTSSVRQGV